ncbi:hypothetical protein LTR84_004932 [Exophiala bonariae]|uniref:Alcohol dehydrogenase-like C-terminal domain-containing protein n=1 Tax=Exophiala bonariae TaxID=1690606 RepID=A0AAV9NNU2_9EURO|nr:hypothetical protein LTR84_004932 [Exophiala bonariae]
MNAEKAAPLFCAGITAYNAILTAELEEGNWYAKALKFNVVALDIEDNVLEQARQGGADYFFNIKSNPDFLGQIHQITSGGLDAVAVFTAVKAGFDIAPAMLRTGAKLIVVRCPPAKISFNATEIALKRYSILGANNSATKDRLVECAEVTQHHNIEPPIRSFKIDQIDEMVGIMQAGKLGGNRLVVVY